MTHSHDLENDHGQDDRLDRGLAFDVATLVNRRGMLGLMAGAGAVMLAGCSASGSSATGGSAPTSATSATSSAEDADAASCAEIPQETAGPYPGDGSNGPNVLSQSGIVRSDIRSSFGSLTTKAAGVPLTIVLTVTDTGTSCAPKAGAAVYLWHCDINGKYSLYSDGVTQENYLRGVQVTDGKGQVRFTSIFPAAYSGRWPHIHFEVYDALSSATAAADPVATSQLALPQDTCRLVYGTDGYSPSVQNLSQTSLSADNVFGDDSAVHQLATMGGSVSKGFTARLTVPV